MATTAAFGSLAIPQPEDSMDMSSPNRHDHEDIDIDFDDFAAADVPVDDAMVDENEPHTLPFPDADMDDASHQDAIHTLEEDMSDEIDDQTVLHNQHATIEEDELIDYDDEDWTGEAQPAEDSLVTSSVAVEPHVAAQPTTNTDSRDVGAVDMTNGGKLGEPGSHLQQSAGAEAYSPNTNGAVVSDHHTEQNTAQPDVGASSAEHDTVEGHTSGDEADKGLNVGSTLTDDAQTEEPTPSTDTGLHPVTIRFRGDELPLFRSKSQPNGLLTDDNLCHVSLSELMDHCKHNLSELYDESISSDQEAVLGFASLPLVSLSETCRPAFDQSLHDVLEVYVNLCSNDIGSDNHPLTLTFSLQYKFSSSLELFKQMADHGKGYSDVPGIPHFSHEHEEVYEENYDEYNEDEGGDHEHGKDHYEFTLESNERGEATADGEIAHVRRATDVADVNHDDSHGDESKSQKLPAENASEQGGTSINQKSTENRSDDNRIGNARDVPNEAVDQGELQSQAELSPSREVVTIGSGSGSPRKEVDDDSIPAPTEHIGDDTTNAEVPSTKNSEETANDVRLVDNKGRTGSNTGDDASGNTENEKLSDETLAVADEESGDGAEAASINDTLVEPDLDTGSLDESHDDIPFDLSPTNTTAVEQLGAETQTVPSEGDTDAGEAHSPEILAELDEDTIDFDDETTEQYEARTRERSQPVEVPSSPTGKRSFSGYADEDVLEFDDDEPDPKKTRSQ